MLAPLAVDEVQVRLDEWVSEADDAAEREAAENGIATVTPPPERELFVSQSIDDIRFVNGHLDKDSAVPVEAPSKRQRSPTSTVSAAPLPNAGPTRSSRSAGSTSPTTRTHPAPPDPTGWCSSPTPSSTTAPPYAAPESAPPDSSRPSSPAAGDGARRTRSVPRRLRRQRRRAPAPSTATRSPTACSPASPPAGCSNGSSPLRVGSSTTAATYGTSPTPNDERSPPATRAAAHPAATPAPNAAKSTTSTPSPTAAPPT